MMRNVQLDSTLEWQKIMKKKKREREPGKNEFKVKIGHLSNSIQWQIFKLKPISITIQSAMPCHAMQTINVIQFIRKK